MRTRDLGLDRAACWATAPRLQHPGCSHGQIKGCQAGGAHSIVGVGYRDRGPSDVAYDWMKDKAEACGLAFDARYIADTFNPNHLGELRDSRGRQRGETVRPGEGVP